MFKLIRRVAAAFGWFAFGWLAHLAMAVAASKGGLNLKGTNEVPLEVPEVATRVSVLGFSGAGESDD